MKKVAQRPWWGSRPAWTMSGLDSSTLAFLRAQVRWSGVVSPS